MTDGQKVPDDVHPATSALLVELAMGKGNAAEPDERKGCGSSELLLLMLADWPGFGGDRQEKRSNADVFIPQQWAFPDELGHHANADLILQNLNFNSTLAQQSFLTRVGVVFANDDLRNSIKQDGA